MINWSMPWSSRMIGAKDESWMMAAKIKPCLEDLVEVGAEVVVVALIVAAVAAVEVVAEAEVWSWWWSRKQPRSWTWSWRTRYQ
ncbi:hypothetical protein PR002_g31462 [Phytophthora rubi]|uniref:Uncharacterized protein n=1 Tax=Phytophthora rubi TaxID=129364 RepID=A0A6A3GHV9_9STRA|nr:hypothetical protein PR002_g31462 [Phytophthora rubi]